MSRLCITIFTTLILFTVLVNPADARQIQFSGYTWNVKTSNDQLMGPGPNYFSDSTETVWIDEEERLHLKITQTAGKWICAEVVSEKSFGYGKYVFYLASRGGSNR